MLYYLKITDANYACASSMETIKSCFLNSISKHIRTMCTLANTSVQHHSNYDKILIRDIAEQVIHKMYDAYVCDLIS